MEAVVITATAAAAAVAVVAVRVRANRDNAEIVWFLTNTLSSLSRS